MPERWSRRAVLATLGTVAIAGCRSDDGADPTPTEVPEASPTPTDRSDGTPASTPTPETDPTPVPPERVDSDWPLPAHDPGRSNATRTAPGPTAAVAELWSVSTGAALSAPVVADGAVYVGASDGTVRALDARTGAERWHQSVGTTATAPGVAGGTLVVRSEDAVVGLAPADGTQRWRVETNEVAALTATEQGVYYLAGPDDAETVPLVAIDVDDGSERWRASVGDPWEPTLLASEETVFVSTGTYNPVPWMFGAESGDLANDRRPGRGADFPSVRFYRDGRLFGIDGFFGNLDATGVQTGVEGWSRGVGRGGSYAASGGAERVYLLHRPYEEPEGRLVAISASTGETAWETTGLAGWTQPPAVAADAVLVTAGDALRCFDPEDGRELWSRPGDVVGESVAVVEDLVVTTDGDTARVLRPP